MGFGLQNITNDAGNVIIDQTYKNLALVASGSLTIDQKADAYSGTYFKNLSVDNLNTPVVAARCGNNWVTCGVASRSNNTFLFQFFVDIVNANNQGPVYYYIFDQVPDSYSGSEHWGYQVKDANGKTTFDSRYKYMKVVDFFGDSDNLQRSYDSSRTYAVAFSTPRVATTVTVSGSQQLLSLSGYGANIQGGTLDMTKNVRFKTFAPGQKLYNYTSTGQYMILDVTNFV